MENTNFVEIKSFKKIISGNVILSDINLSFKRGRVYGFKGKNGSGKTMLFRAVCGLIRPTEGKVIVNGRTLGNEVSFPENTGVLIEYPGFLPGFTGFKNLKYLADINGKIGIRAIKHAIKMVGLDPEDKRKFKKYSLGMKQRLGIAQAIMEDPELIILDEPTNALDTDGVKQLNDIIIDLKKKNKTILISNHDKEELAMMADEIYTIESGKIIDHVILDKE